MNEQLYDFKPVVLPTDILEIASYAAMRKMEKEKNGEIHLVHDIDTVERQRLRSLVMAYTTIFSVCGTQPEIKRKSCEFELERITGVSNRTCLRYVQALLGEGLAFVKVKQEGLGKGEKFLCCVSNRVFMEWICALTRKHAEMEWVEVNGEKKKNYTSVIYRCICNSWKGRKRFKYCIKQDYSDKRPSAYSLDTFVNFETLTMARIPFKYGTKKSDIMDSIAANVMVSADMLRKEGTNIIRKAFERELEVPAEAVNEAIDACVEVLGADYRGELVGSTIGLGEDKFDYLYGELTPEEDMLQVYVKKPMGKRQYVYGLKSFNESQITATTYMSGLTLARKLGLSDKCSGYNYRKRTAEAGTMEIVSHEIELDVPNMSYSEASEKFSLGVPSTQIFAYKSNKGVISVRRYNGILLARKVDEQAKDMRLVKLVFQTCSSLVPAQDSYSFVSVVEEQKIVTLVDSEISKIANSVSLRYSVDGNNKSLVNSR